jgi:hypothetical protein
VRLHSAEVWRTLVLLPSTLNAEAANAGSRSPVAFAGHVALFAQLDPASLTLLERSGLVFLPIGPRAPPSSATETSTLSATTAANGTPTPTYLAWTSFEASIFGLHISSSGQLAIDAFHVRPDAQNRLILTPTRSLTLNYPIPPGDQTAPLTIQTMGLTCTAQHFLVLISRLDFCGHMCSGTMQLVFHRDSGKFIDPTSERDADLLVAEYLEHHLIHSPKHFHPMSGTCYDPVNNTIWSYAAQLHAISAWTVPTTVHAEADISVHLVQQSISLLNNVARLPSYPTSTHILSNVFRGSPTVMFPSIRAATGCADATSMQLLDACMSLWAQCPSDPAAISADTALDLLRPLLLPTEEITGAKVGEALAAWDRARDHAATVWLRALPVWHRDLPTCLMFVASQGRCSSLRNRLWSYLSDNLDAALQALVNLPGATDSNDDISISIPSSLTSASISPKLAWFGDLCADDSFAPGGLLEVLMSESVDETESCLSHIDDADASTSLASDSDFVVSLPLAPRLTPLLGFLTRVLRHMLSMWVASKVASTVITAFVTCFCRLARRLSGKLDQAHLTAANARKASRILQASLLGAMGPAWIIVLEGELTAASSSHNQTATKHRSDEVKATVSGLCGSFQGSGSASGCTPLIVRPFLCVLALKHVSLYMMQSNSVL